MARTQAIDFDEKREAISRSAARLFATNGFAATSISELAADCNISKSLIYHYFPSKEHILFAAMTQHMDRLVETLCVERAVHPDPEEDLRQVTKLLLDTYDGAADYQKILLYELNHLPTEAREKIVSKQRAVIDAISQILVRLSPNQTYDRTDIRTKTMLYFSMLNWTHSWFHPNRPLSRSDLANRISDMVQSSF